MHAGPAHDPRGDLLADVRLAALERDPWVWVDRIADATRPAYSLDTLRESADFAGDLVRLTDALLADASLILDGCDNFETRLAVNRA